LKGKKSIEKKKKKVKGGNGAMEGNFEFLYNFQPASTTRRFHAG